MTKSSGVFRFLHTLESGNPLRRFHKEKRAAIDECERAATGPGTSGTSRVSTGDRGEAAIFCIGAAGQALLSARWGSR